LSHILSFGLLSRGKMASFFGKSKCDVTPQMGGGADFHLLNFSQSEFLVP